MVISVAGVGHQTLLTFLSAGCHSCAPFWHVDSATAALLSERAVQLVLVTRGPERVDLRAVKALAPPDHTTVMSSQAWEDYRAGWYPYVVLIDGPSSSVIAEGAAGSWDQVLALVAAENASSLTQIDRDIESLPRSWLDPRLRVAPSGIDGVGLRAEGAIKTNEVVIMLAGMHVTAEEAARMVSRGEASRSLGLDEDDHLAQDSEDQAAKENHSCEPNTWLQDNDGLVLVARGEIEMGDELTVDYATMIADPHWRMVCRCGSPQCRELITGEDWKLPHLQDRYQNHFAPLLAHRISASSDSEEMPVM